MRPNCGSGFQCRRGNCGWVPFPSSSSIQDRRNPLLDAIGRMDNPCERPAYDSSCRAVPKFRSPVQEPQCDINLYRAEQSEAKIREYWEQRQKYLDTYCPTQPCQQQMIIESLDPINYPIAVQLPNSGPEWILKDKPCKTDIIAGFFNPNDNLSVEETRRRACDPFYEPCGPGGLRPYPCRGVISYPPQTWVSSIQEKRLCVPSNCQGSKYLTPEYLSEKAIARCELEERKRMEKEMEMREELKRLGYEAYDPCCGEKFSQSPYCLLNKCS